MSDRAILQTGDTVLFIDRKEREYLRTLKTGGRISLHGGLLQADQVIGLPEGSLVHTARNEPFRIFRPTYAHLIPNLPRKAQVIYPKDVGIMLLWGDVFPGASVVEVGAGPGALTIALLRAIGPSGTLVTVEAREDFCEMSRENVTRFFGEASNWTLMLGDAYEGIEAHDADRLLIDVPEPWRVLPHAARALRPGGILVGYVPTVVQVKALVDELRAHTGFAAIEVMENLLRFWHVKDLSVRPEHRMVAHTGFIIVARRVPEAQVSQENSFLSSS
jgi:tRNA (adenine57-N1/adenine58-N1)-methyltransferase